MKTVTCDACGKFLDSRTKLQGTLKLIGTHGISEYNLGDYCENCTDDILNFVEFLKVFRNDAPDRTENRQINFKSINFENCKHRIHDKNRKHCDPNKKPCRKVPFKDCLLIQEALKEEKAK